MAEHASWEMVGKGCGRIDNYGGGNGVVWWGYYECGEAVCIAHDPVKEETAG